MFNVESIRLNDHIIIYSRPTTWSSVLCERSTNQLTTPCVARIIDYQNYGNHVAAKIRVNGTIYGADLNALSECSDKIIDLRGYFVKILSDCITDRLNTGSTYIIQEIVDDCVTIIANDGRPIYLCMARFADDEIELLYNNDIYPVPVEHKPIEKKLFPILLYKSHEEIKLPVRKKIKKPLTHIQEQLVKILLYQPEDLRSFISHTTNPGYCVNFINKLLPTRVGYEFDTCGYTKVPDEFHQIIKNTEYSKKQRNNISGRANSIFYSDIDSPTGTFQKETNREIRFSFNHISGFKKLKLLLHAMVQNGINPAENGGLHIHIDLSPVLDCSWVSYNTIDQLKERTKILYKYRGYIYNIFGIDKCETYVRDKSKFLKYGSERGRISVLKGHNTIEWRLANTTFDYTQIMKWTIFCHLMTDLVKYPNKKFNMDLYENIRYVA